MKKYFNLQLFDNGGEGGSGGGQGGNAGDGNGREMPGIMEAPEATASSRPRRSPRLVQNAPRRPLSAPISSSRA